MNVQQSKLVHSKKYSYGDRRLENLIIQGDNQEVLKLLKNEFKGKINCIYIDPPYNNGEIYPHYEDDKEHIRWLQDITQVLTELKEFLAKDGSIWISIDDNEMHYLKVAADSVFGRKNFITTIVWQQRTTRENRAVFSKNHEYILVYAKDPNFFKLKRNLLPLTEDVLARYKNPDKDLRGPWQSISANVQAGHATKSQFYKVISPNGKAFVPPNGRCWLFNEYKMLNEIKSNNIWFGKDGNSVPRVKKFLNGASIGLTPQTLWLGNEVGTNNDAKKHLLELFPEESLFDTPKPEQLIHRIFQIATNEEDLIMDCFLGSGSTISTAQKMNRKYIGIEFGNHIIDFAVKRMQSVIGGEKGGITKKINWKGGGGFNFYKLKK